MEKSSNNKATAPSEKSQNPETIYQRLHDSGFEKTFRVEDNYLFCAESNQQFEPTDVTIKGTFRFEGVSDPEDMSIVYALETSNGTRGVLVDAFGTYADPEVAEFMKQIISRDLGASEQAKSTEH